MSNSANSQLFGSSESTQNKTFQWQENSNTKVYFMSILGGRNQKFENPKSSASAQAATSQETPKIGNSDGAAPSLKLHQATAASATSTAVPVLTASLPGATESKLSSDQVTTAPANDITSSSMVNHEQSTLADDRKQRVCNSCEDKYKREENTSDVKEWLYSDTCTNCRNDILSHHLSISRLQSPEHHKTTTTKYHEKEEVNSCRCF